MDDRNEIMQSFLPNVFKEIYNKLESKGYVTDIEDTIGSTQIEEIDQEMFDDLCGKFGLNVSMKIATVGGFYTGTSERKGANYMIYNEESYTQEEAQKKLDSISKI